MVIWLSGRAVKTQLQIVLTGLFAAMDGYPIKNNKQTHTPIGYPSVAAICMTALSLSQITIFFTILELAAVIKATFIPFLLNFSQMQELVKGARYLLIIHEVLVAMDFFSAGVQDQTLEEESQRLAS